MKRSLIATLLLCTGMHAQAQEEFQAGAPLSAVNEQGETVPLSDNVRVFGSFRFAESCTFDPERNLILAMNAGVGDDDGYVSLINPDGTVHTAKWIGATREGMTLDRPLGSAIRDGVLYAADRDTVRLFDLDSGEPLDEIRVPDANSLNGIAVAEDGIIYVSNTRPPERLYRITPDGEVNVFMEGSPLALPNGVAIDNDGNIVVVNVGDNGVYTLRPNGSLLRAEQAVEGGNDGVVITADGTKYVSSVRHGSVSRIRPGEEAEIIASGIPSAASLCYDSRQHQLVIPMNDNNALAFIPL